MSVQVNEALRYGVTVRFDEAEEALVKAAIGGDAQAFARLYDQHLERVYRYTYYWVGNRPDAEDLAQQVFLHAWQAIKRYRNTGASFIAWLLTIAHNLVISFFRKAKDISYLDLEPHIQAHWADPEAEVFAKHNQLELRRAILQLKPEQQQVIVMRFVEHLDYEAIATVLGKREGNIRVIQHRALIELRRIMDYQGNL